MGWGGVPTTFQQGRRATQIASAAAKRAQQLKDVRSGQYTYSDRGTEYAPGGNQYGGMVNQGLAYQKTQPGGGTTWWMDFMPTETRAQAIRTPSMLKQIAAEFGGAAGSNVNPFANQNLGGGGGYGGGGGGGGAAGPAGLDQASLDWLLAQIGRGRPQDLGFNPLDLPDPAQFLGQFDTAAYNTARQGIGTGIEAIRGRGNQAFDTAVGELNRYQNPYAGGLQTQNPDQYAAMERMARANNATGALGQVAGEGVQADRAFANAMALLAGNDQSRQAANLRATEADRRMMDTNLGLEGNMLNLGVNMAQAKGQTAWDQMLRQAQLEAANQESAQNWTRGNTVGDTNVANRNAWNQSILQTLMQLVGAKAPDVTLPANFGGFA